MRNQKADEEDQQNPEAPGKQFDDAVDQGILVATAESSKR
jgi:hypothetical protein